MKKLVLLFSTVLLTSFSAKALLLEPYLTYTLSGSADYASGSSVTGTGLGARVGWTFMGFGLGVDALLTGKFNYKNGGTSVDTTPSYYGLFVSYDFPILVRGYLSYLLEAKDKGSAGDYYKGTATKLGVQYTGLPFVAIGLETYMGNYSDYTSAGGVNSGVSDKSSVTNLVVSLPLSL